MKKLYSIIAALTLTFVGGVGAASMASATYPPVEVCVPSEGTEPYDEVITEAYDETIIVSEAIDRWYSWTGGPSETHPFPSDDWQVDNGNHNGFDQAPGLLQRDKGSSGESDFFYHEVVAELTEVVHHEAVIEHHEGTPPVICPPTDEPTEEPTQTPTPTPTPSETPQTYSPTCTEANGTEQIEGDGVLTVTGGWDSDWFDLGSPGTLADIGTALDIQADPLLYTGLHIDLEGGRTITFEEIYGGPLWSESSFEGIPAGMGYAAFATIGDYIHLYGNLEVTNVRLLYTHPEASSTTFTSFTIGCTTFTFVPPSEEPTPTPTPTPTEPPAEEPTPTETPVPTQTPVPSATPSATATPVVAVASSTPTSLAATGSWLERIAPWGLGFLVLGAAAVALRWAGRRYSAPVE